MTLADDQEALAAEYVLGTLDADERAQAEALAAVNPDFAAAVGRWERRLGELSAMVEPVEPPPEAFGRIMARIAEAEPAAAIRLPEVPLPPKPPAADNGGGGAQVIELTRRVKRWRGLATATSALAACLVALVATREFAPQVLPEALRPATTQPSGRFVAVLQRDAGAPAFLMTVDLASRTLTVRRVAAEQEAGKSYELWLVSDRFPAPRSLGLVGADAFTVRPLQATYDPSTIEGATYAVSLEPEGGSPTGAPTGPVLFLGKLVEATPRS